MQYREYGRTGTRVSALGYGAMRLPFDEAITNYLSMGAISTALGLVLVMLRRRPNPV